ncbi:MAG: hypothetical protein WCT85_05260 [Parachlamydiales bacterium]|jgi:Leucine-rich repeat (LRR) protein
MTIYNSNNSRFIPTLFACYFYNLSYKTLYGVIHSKTNKYTYSFEIYLAQLIIDSIPKHQFDIFASEVTTVLESPNQAPRATVYFKKYVQLTNEEVKEFYKKSFSETILRILDLKKTSELSSSRSSIAACIKVNQRLKDDNLLLFIVRLSMAQSQISSQTQKIFADLLKTLEGLDSSAKACYVRTWFEEKKDTPELSTIKCLCLNNLGLTQVPDELVYFRNLEKLYLSDNNLCYLPGNFLEQNIKLIVLHLDRNNLRFLPQDFLANARNLLCLSVSENRIRFIPDDFLKNSPLIQAISFRCNRLSYLPDTFLQRAPMLRFLLLNCNHLIGMPEIENFLNNSPLLECANLRDNYFNYGNQNMQRRGAIYY